MNQFFTQTFFPEIKRRNIDTIIHCGDVFDRRKYINFLTMKQFQQSFFEQIAENNLRMIVIPGNHDCPLKNMTTVNALNILLRGYPQIEVLNHPTEIEIGGASFLFAPWISAENGETVTEAIEQSQARFVVGHFEINGFEVRAGSIMDHGMEMSLFNKFELVMSGHFHKRSTIGNITYVGTPFQMSWGDFGMTKGFHVLDTETGELEFIANKDELFISLAYDDTGSNDDATGLLASVSEIDVLDKYVRVVIKAKTNPYLFDLLIDHLEGRGALSVQPVNRNEILLTDDQDQQLDDSIETSEMMLVRYVESLDLSTSAIDKSALITLLLAIYQQAIMSSSQISSVE